MSIFEHSSTRKTGRTFTETPSRILFKEAGLPATWVQHDGNEYCAHCIGCTNEPCRTFTKQEVTIPAVKSVASDPNRNVCPVNAINWNVISETAEINSDACIGCGLCISRCPVGAIYMDDKTASVSSMPPSASPIATDAGILPKISDFQKSQIENLPQIEYLSPINYDLNVHHVVKELISSSNAVQIAAVRTALIVSAGPSISRRTGDVHTRMDGVYSTTDGAIGSFEVEFGFDSLEAARASLDDVAVLQGIYGLPMHSQSPLVVCAVLPRERQGYWQVLQDISNVLGLNVRTITFGALLLLTWNNKPINSDLLDHVTPRFGSTSIRSAIESTLRRKVDLTIGECGVLEPEK